MTPDSHALWERARRWASQGRYDDAEAAYREALRLAPDDVRARLGLGLCLRRQRRPADAEAVLREAVLLQPGRSEEHTSELQSPCNLVCRLLLEKKKIRGWSSF